MARQNNLEAFLLVQDIEDFQYDAARQGKEGLHPFALERLDKYF